MKYANQGKAPVIHPSAYVAPTATISGDVTIGENSAVLHGAILTAEGAPLVIGKDCVIMENAVVKASGGSALQFPATIRDGCIVGPHAYVAGATIGTGCFISSGAKIYNGVTVLDGTTIEHNTVLQEGSKSQFFETVFNIPQTHDVRAQAARTYAKFLRTSHSADTPVLEEAKRVTKPVARRTEEPPPQQSADVEGVVDAMMLELREMEQRRQDALRKQQKKR